MQCFLQWYITAAHVGKFSLDIGYLQRRERETRSTTEDFVKMKSYVVFTLLLLQTLYVLSQAQVNFDDRCKLQKDEGSCNALLPMYYYNSALKKCEMFFYGGCDGNDNRFDTFAECEKACGTPVDKCTLEKDAGLCKVYVLRFYFNRVSKKCEMFIYGGCLGNDNRFETVEDCQDACSACKNCKFGGHCVNNVCECERPCPRNYDPLCGEDGVTYPNSCALAVAECRKQKKISHKDGKCS